MATVFMRHNNLACYGTIYNPSIAKGRSEAPFFSAYFRSTSSSG